MKHHVFLVILAQDWVKILIGLIFFLRLKNMRQNDNFQRKMAKFGNGDNNSLVKNSILIPMAHGYSLDWWLWWNIKHNGLFNWSESAKNDWKWVFLCKLLKMTANQKVQKCTVWRLSAFRSWRHNNASFKQIFFLESHYFWRFSQPTPVLWPMQSPAITGIHHQTKNMTRSSPKHLIYSIQTIQNAFRCKILVKQTIEITFYFIRWKCKISTGVRATKNQLSVTK